MADNTQELLPPSRRERLNAWARRNRVGSRWEQAYPWFGAVAVGVPCMMAKIDSNMFGGVLKDVLPSAVSVAAIFAGLQGAMHAILLTMLQSRAVRRLKQERLWDKLIGFVRLGITSLILFVAVAMSCIIANAIGHSPTWYRTMTGTLVALFAFSMLASLRITLVEIKLLQVPEERPALQGEALR